MEEKRIYWLFSDGSIAHIKGRPFSGKAVAWRFENWHEWKDMSNAPQNYYGI